MEFMNPIFWKNIGNLQALYLLNGVLLMIIHALLIRKHLLGISIGTGI